MTFIPKVNESELIRTKRIRQVSQMATKMRPKIYVFSGARLGRVRDEGLGTILTPLGQFIFLFFIYEINIRAQ